jgi:SAM-dependent methyltransferase
MLKISIQEKINFFRRTKYFNLYQCNNFKVILMKKEVSLITSLPQHLLAQQWQIVWVFIFSLLFVAGLQAQQRDVPYVPTPEDVVEKMLDAANVGPGDYVIDLGSGDGRIVIAAAKRGAFAHGVDIDPQRIKEANANARQAGVEDKVVFVEGNIFETDISAASVITMYLLSTVNLKLRPKLLDTLEPGTRIVSHSFDMNDWNPDNQYNVDYRNVYYWVIPAKIDGSWNWNLDGKKFTMDVTQKFQELELALKSGNTKLNVSESALSGDRISFRASNPSNGERYVFSGRIEDEKITGLVQVHNGTESSVESWSASNGRVSGK